MQKSTKCKEGLNIEKVYYYCQVYEFPQMSLLVHRAMIWTPFDYMFDRSGWETESALHKML